MPSWHHKVTVHDAEDVLAHLTQTMTEVPPALYCDDKGTCYFDEGPNPFTEAIEHLLDDIGYAGWELIQVTLKPDQMICFWKQPYERE